MEPIIYDDFKKECSSEIFSELDDLIQKQYQERYTTIYYGQNMKKVKKLITPGINTKELKEFINSLIPESYKYNTNDEDIQLQKPPNVIVEEAKEKEISNSSKTKISYNENPYETRTVSKFCVSEFIDTNCEESSKK